MSVFCAGLSALLLFGVWCLLFAVVERCPALLVVGCWLFVVVVVVGCVLPLLLCVVCVQRRCLLCVAFVVCWLVCVAVRC